MAELGLVVPFWLIVLIWVAKIIWLALICTLLAWLGIRALDALTPLRPQLPLPKPEKVPHLTLFRSLA